MSIASQITESLGPFARESEDLGLFVEGLTAPMEEVYSIIGEEDQEFGWSVVLDPATCPEDALPWLAQFEGVELTEDMTVADRRAAIAAREGAARGRPETLRSRVIRTLTISRRVIIRERYNDNAYLLQIRTLDSETPDEALTRAAILSQKPAGIVLDYETYTDGTYGELGVAYASYSEIDTSETYTDLLVSLSA